MLAHKKIVWANSSIAFLNVYKPNKHAKATKKKTSDTQRNRLCCVLAKLVGGERRVGWVVIIIFKRRTQFGWSKYGCSQLVCGFFKIDGPFNVPIRTQCLC